MDPDRIATFWLVIVLGAPIALALILWLGMLYDIIVTPADIWDLAGHDRAFNLILLFLLGPVGAILYGLAVRPQLAREIMRNAAWEAKHGTPGWPEPQEEAA